VTYAFLSYKREDEVRVGRIARSLEQAGIEVWWDRGLPGGESWQQMITEKLEAAGCVIVIWSFGSIAPEGSYVRDEARQGLHRGVLVPVTIDRVRTLPLGFGEVQAIDLIHWRGDARDPFFRDLVEAVRAKLDGVKSPPPRGPVARVRRRVFFGGASATTLAAFLILAINAFGVTAKICTVPGLQPSLSDACGALRLGNRPNRVERIAWEQLPKGNCSALRTYVLKHPESPLSNEANLLIDARQTSATETWTSTARPLPLVASADGRGSLDQATAKAAALQRANPAAERICRPFAAGTLFRFVSAQARADSWSCSSGGGGWVCGFQGWADCALQVRKEVVAESCGPQR
jgi:hypothetical protein